MEVITIDSKAYKEIMDKLDLIYENCQKRLQTEINDGKDIWLDSFEVSEMLNISTRTLQRLRTEGAIPFSYIRRRCRYKLQDICRALDDKTISADHRFIVEFKRKFNMLNDCEK